MATDAAASSDTLDSKALKLGDVIILALASSGPTQSVAVTLAALLATVSYAGVVPIFISFIPMIGIAIGYQRLNAWQSSAGATYSWVGKALNPHAGFFAGWIMLMYYTVGTTSLTVPLGTYSLSFFSDDLANNKYAVAAVGTVLNLLVLWVAARGIRTSARFQWGWAAFEYLVILAFGIAALVMIYGNHLDGAVKVNSSWFTIDGAGGWPAVLSGVLLAIFLYSGWDTAAYVSEESKGRKAGNAAVLSVVILFFLYSFAVFAFQGVAPYQNMQDHADNILAYVGQLIGGNFWANVMIVAVLGGTLASLQAAIVSSSRISYAMGRDGVFPRWFGKVDDRTKSPLNATILLGLLNVVFLWGSTLFDSIGQALSDIVSTLGLMAAIFYLLTGFTAIWYYRRTIVSSPKNFLLGGVMPGIGVLFLAFVLIKSLTSGDLDAVQLTFGFGLAALGLVLSFVSAYRGKSPFYRGEMAEASGTSNQS
jgi:amino acid transporter